jgi:hypothetical protein
MHERILLMSPPGAGKTTQLINIVNYLGELKKKVFVVDLEDKFEAGIGTIPSHVDFMVSFDWDTGDEKTNNPGLVQVADKIIRDAKPGDWILIDRIDLSWPRVQRWYTQAKYKEDLATLMMKKAITMTKPAMFIPRFDQSSWLVINEQFETFMNNILYKSQCNVVLTSGIRAPDESSPMEIYGSVKAVPRGQKELPHQPHSVFLLSQRKESRSDNKWYITTAKDLKDRKYLDDEELADFTIQYLEQYYNAETIKNEQRNTLRR